MQLPYFCSKMLPCLFLISSLLKPCVDDCQRIDHTKLRKCHTLVINSMTAKNFHPLTISIDSTINIVLKSPTIMRTSFSKCYLFIASYRFSFLAVILAHQPATLSLSLMTLELIGFHSEPPSLHPFDASSSNSDRAIAGVSQFVRTIIICTCTLSSM